MAVNLQAYQQIKTALDAQQVTLVAVSKTKPVSDILELYEQGQRDFGENYVQELLDKHPQLPEDVRWHFIGHLQSNKVKYIAPFVQLIHGVDSFSLLKEINKQAAKQNRVIEVLLQLHIAQEETKFGLDKDELDQIISQLAASPMPHIKIRGLMGMASFTDNQEKLKQEFQLLHSLMQYTRAKLGNDSSINILSMGMSGDYPLAIAEGSTMVRIGSLLFGARTNSQ